MAEEPVVIVGPPSWALSDPSRPLAGVAAIATYLAAQGVAIEVLDLNHAFLGHLKQELGRRTGRDPWMVERSEIAAWAESRKREVNARYVARQGPLRSDSPFGFSMLVEHNSSRLPAFLESDANPYTGAFTELLDLERLAVPGRIIGISIIAPSQLLATLTLARLLKQRCPSCLVVVGGNFVTLCLDVFREAHPLLRDIDFAVPFDGEEVFLALIADLRAGGSGERPGVVARRGGEIRYEPALPNPALVAALPAPDYTLFDKWRRFDVLPYETARGCAWARCKFCYHSGYYGKRYVPKPIAKVVADLREITSHHPAREITFSDAELPPRRFRELALALIEAQLGLGWWCMGRLQDGWDRATFELGRRAGCHHIDWGLEHVDPRLTSYYGKPIDRAQAHQIFEDCHAAGIGVLVQTMTGFPTETEAERASLLVFLDDHRQLFESTPQVFMLARNTEFFAERARHGIEADVTEDDLFASGYEYVNRSPTIDALAEQLRRRTAQTPRPPSAG